MTVGYTPAYRWQKVESGCYRCDEKGFTVTRQDNGCWRLEDDSTDVYWWFDTKRDAQAHAEYRGGWK